MWVKKHMCKWVNTIKPNQTLADAVKKMVEKKTNSLVVVDDNDKPVGIVSSHLLIQEAVPEHLKSNEMFSQFGAAGTFAKYAKRVKDHKVEDFMHKDFHVLNENDALIEAATYVLEGARRILPVVNEKNKLTGVITRTGIKIALYNAIFDDHLEDPKAACSCQEKKSKQE